MRTQDIAGVAACRNFYIDLMDAKGALTGTDGWSLKPALVSWKTVAVLALLFQLPSMFRFLLIPLTLLVLAATSFAVVIVAGYCLAKRRPRRGASVSLILLLPALL